MVELLTIILGFCLISLIIFEIRLNRSNDRVEELKEIMFEHILGEH